MSTEIPIINLLRVALGILLSSWLLGCTNHRSMSSLVKNVGYGPIVYERSYKLIPRKSRNGNTYIVKHGDTLFYIAWITCNNFRHLARHNNIREPYSLKEGQIIKLDNNSTNEYSDLVMAIDTTLGKSPKSLPRNRRHITIVNSSSTNANSNELKKQNASSGVVEKKIPPLFALPTASFVSSSSLVSSWRWPTKGRIIDNFSLSEGGNKGVDIAGYSGQPIFAIGEGRVVYAGNALRGYGNLIIIKHNNNYLSAYAHNDTILVRERQKVKKGQKVATMGSTGTSSVRLHFEIRYKGKSVNPLHYLPNRQN